MTLAEGIPGMNLTVKGINCSDLKLRLMAMVVVPGTKVLVCPSAPLGDPMAIKVRSYKLAMRRQDASSVEVEAI